MSSFSFCILLVRFFLSGDGTWSPEARIADTTPAADTCRKVVEFQYTHKVLEGMVCHDKREGVWREWYADGRLKDSAVYKDGVRVYTANAVKKAKGVLVFKGDPKEFFKDSTYECSVRVNVGHGLRDIKGDYDGVPDTVYPPPFYFGVDGGARDEFQYYFTPKATGKYKLMISLSGDAAITAGNVAFYEQDIEILHK